MDVLVVEKSSPEAEWLEERIRSWGYRPCRAIGASAAAALADRRCFDLVVLNLGLENGSSFALIRRLNRAWPAVRIIGLADAGSRQVELKARSGGVIHYMVKPPDEEELLTVMRHLAHKINTETLEKGDPT